MDTTWLIITLISLAFSAFFSGIEIAFVTSDRVRVELDVQKGGFVGKVLNLFYSRSEFFISTILVGNNIVLVIYGMGAAKMIEPTLEGWLDNQALVLIAQTLISTGIILITGEFLPKTIFRINPNRSMQLFAPLTATIYLLLYPISLFTTWLSKILMKIFGVKDRNANSAHCRWSTSTNTLSRQSTSRPKRKPRLKTKLRFSTTPSTSRPYTCATA